MTDYTEQQRKEIEEFLLKSLEEISIKDFPAKHREHLGASVIGEECSRYLWYAFRWVKLNQFLGRMRRLFNRGHREEPEITRLLDLMGFFSRSIDPLTDKQYKFSAVDGHYGGSCDGVLLMPWDRKDDSERILGEFKTHNEKLFTKLKKEKLKLAHPKHYAQMCTYGKAFKIRYGLYFAVNKNDDDIYIEFLELDWNYAEQLEKKASDIIHAEFPPNKISDNPAYFRCKYCDFHGICHRGEPVETNCRSCKNAKPVEKGEWFCGKFSNVIPNDFIAKGCNQHESIT